MNLFGLFVVAAIAEAVWETLKMTWQQGRASKDRIGALVVSIVIALTTQLDVLYLVEIPSKIPYVGIILTGVLISRGSNIVHDIFASVDNFHIKTKPSNGTASVPKEE